MKDMQRGTKRKRYNPPTEAIGAKITKKLYHHLKDVRKAAKKAKDFETRKLVKKLNELRRKDGAPKDITDHESQLQALKEIGHDEIGNTALKTKILKDRVLSTNEDVQTALTNELSTKVVTPAPAGTLASKVQSRLLSSKILAQEVSASIEALRNLIQPETAIKEDSDMDEDGVEIPRQTKKVKSRGKMENGDMDVDPVVDDDAEMQGLEDGVEDTELVDETGWESGTVGDDENEADDGWESGSLDGELLSGDEEDETGSDDEEGHPKRTTKVVAESSRPSKATNSTAQSTFLPSLSVGFIRGSDDSDFSEEETKFADSVVKKNRRGQRARRAIWEKKYGRNANHKKKEIDENNAIAKEKAERRRAKVDRLPNSSRARDTKGGGGFKKPFVVSQQSQDSGWKSRTTGSQNTESSAGAFKRNEGKPLHPSWEAKRKLKEKDTGGIVPSQGKKIKFI